MSDDPRLLPAPEPVELLPAPRPSRHAAHPARRNRIVAITVGMLGLVLLVGWFFHHREASRAKEANERARDRLPTVAVTTVKASPSTSDLLLPGSVTAFTEASLFARASGYLRIRRADIGDTVRRGQVLAEIDSPDLDQEVLQGRAAVAQARQQAGQAEASVGDARARVELGQVTYRRLSVLIRDQAVAQQDVDQARQTLDTAQATLSSSIASAGAARDNVRIAQASAQRLAVLQGYEKLRAPFDGIVTARNIDEGALVNGAGATSAQSGTTGPSNASSSGSAAMSGSTTSGGSTASSGSSTSAQGGGSSELFRVAQIDRLRVFVSVPQENAGAVEPGNEAAVFVQGFAEPFAGRVTRTARAIDPTARTLLTEVEIPNARRLLMPGMYAQVRFSSPRAQPPLLVPGEAVIAHADGLHVAVIEDLRPEDRERLPKSHGSEKGEQKNGDAQKKAGPEDQASNGNGGDKDEAQDPAKAKRIRLQAVEVGRDYGTEIEITRGLRSDQKIVSNPGDDVIEGALVMPKERKPDARSGDSPGAKEAPSGNQSPSMKAPTKGKSGGSKS